MNLGSFKNYVTNKLVTYKSYVCVYVCFCVGGCKQELTLCCIATYNYTIHIQIYAEHNQQ